MPDVIMYVVAGYSFDCDLHMLIKTFPCMKEGLKSMEKTVDIQMLYTQVNCVNMVFICCTVYYSL